MAKNFVKRLVAEVYAKKCITSEDVKRIASECGIDPRTSWIRSIISRLKKRSIIVSPSRGVYCRST